jgi:ribose/xylose/arabinose/galactoside ABC-type transport system permease subunit
MSESRLNNIVHRILTRIQFQSIPGVMWGLLGLIIVLGIISPRSVEPRHLLYLTRQGAALGLVAIGQTIVMISGGLDLSMGSSVILADVLAAQLIAGNEERVLPVLLIVLLVGAFIGLLNGISISLLRVSPFIATLGMNLIIFGAALIYSGGAPKGNIPANMRFWGNGFFFNVIPAAVLVWFPISVLAALFIRRTSTGRRIVAFGANRRAAEMSGVRTRLTETLAYVISGVMAAAGGLLLVAYVGVGTLEVGTDFLLGSIAAAVIGGTPFEGGRGTIFGTIVGVLFLMTLYSLLTIVNLPVSGRRIVEGAVILGALALYARERK